MGMEARSPEGNPPSMNIFLAQPTTAPGREGTATAAALLGTNAAQAAPLAHGELGLAKHLGNFCRAVPVLDGALLHKHVQQRVQLVKAAFDIEEP